MSLRIDLLASKDYANEKIQHSVWEKTKHNYEQEGFSRDGFYDHINEHFCLAEENCVAIFAPQFNRGKNEMEIQPYRIPCTSLMGDPRWFSYYLEEDASGKQKRPTRLTERVRMLHLLLCLNACETVQL